MLTDVELVIFVPVFPTSLAVLWKPLALDLGNIEEQTPMHEHSEILN